MTTKYMKVISLPISIEAFWQLPRHPAFKYEYLGDYALLSPRPKFYHARLDLSRLSPPANLACLEAHRFEPVEDGQFTDLKKLFCGAFSRIAPFECLEGEAMDDAAHECLQRTLTGGDGPVIQRASLVARHAEDKSITGAALITLIPEAELTDWDAYHWREPPADDAVEQRRGRPHLTWIFVNPWHMGNGIGTALLHAVANELRKLGFDELISTMLLGNHQSTLWHWRNGFELLTNPYSMRRMKQEIAKNRMADRKRKSHDEASEK